MEFVVIGIVFIPVLNSQYEGREDGEVDPQLIEESIGLEEVDHEVGEGLATR